MSRKDSRATSMACSSRQRRAELLLESVRHPSNHIPVQIKSAPEFRHLNSAPDGLLGELLDTDITVIDNIEQSSGLQRHIMHVNFDPPLDYHVTCIQKSI